MTTVATNAVRPEREAPEDLRQVVGERRLIELALEAAHFVGESLPRPVSLSVDQPAPGLLLTLLTYCYAAGIYGSDDIERACESDASARYICAGARPDRDGLRAFRRANRPWIESCLAWVYRRLYPEASSQPAIAAVVRQKLELAVITDTAVADC